MSDKRRRPENLNIDKIVRCRVKNMRRKSFVQSELGGRWAVDQVKTCQGDLKSVKTDGKQLTDCLLLLLHLGDCRHKDQNEYDEHCTVSIDRQMGVNTHTHARGERKKETKEDRNKERKREYW